MRTVRHLFTALTLIMVTGCTSDKLSYDQLWEGFVSPPKEAHPLVWWHWMNGNITKEGIRKDIEWMHQSGIAGFHAFDAGMATPQIVDKRIEYMTPEWNDAFAYALSLADSLGMEVSIASSPGWSSTGGPWVTPQDAMKKLVWRQMRVKGGERYTGPLPDAFDMSSTFQDIPLNSYAGRHELPTDERYYEDIAVLAVNLPACDVPLEEMGCTVSSSSGNFTLEQLTNDSMADFGRLESEEGMYIQFDFPQSQTMKALTFVTWSKRDRGHSDPAICRDTLTVSDDGKTFRSVCALPVGSALQQTISFPETSGRHFRVQFGRPYHINPHKKDDMRVFDIDHVDIAKLVIHPAGRVHHFEEKAAFAACHDLLDFPTPDFHDADAVSTVLDVSEYYNGGILDWDVPEGNWMILRLGASLTGKKNHPASPEATGLEVSKLDREAWIRYFRNYLDMYKKASSGRMGQTGIQYLLTDSYEAHHDNGSKVMREEFIKRRGYDPLPWMPAMTGIIVSSAAETDAFLWDWRRTEDELFSENYNILTEFVQKEYGMKGCYVEAHENGRVFPSDGMDIKSNATCPMSCCWLPPAISFPDRMAEGESDIRESASVANIFGKKQVAAESFTQTGESRRAYTYCPDNLKAAADRELAWGVNKFVIHESTHQPCDDKFPGLSLEKYGQWFNRHETWADNARVWMDYLARSSYMLMQGRAVNDILCYYGEDNNATANYSHSTPDIPAGFNYDFANPTVIRKMLKAHNGILTTKTGMSYRILFLDPRCRKMSTDILQKIREFADNGVIICGTVPSETTGMKESREIFEELVNDIWNSGRSNVLGDVGLNEAVTAAGLLRDVAFPSEMNLCYVHRSLPGCDIYWLNNPSDNEVSGNVTFRISGRKPELWHPVSMVKKEVSYKLLPDKTETILDFGPGESYFIVFAKDAEEQIHVVSATGLEQLAELKDGWNITFQKGRGADGVAIYGTDLKSLTEFDNPAIKYFSGTVTYFNKFTLDSISEKVFIDLGDVKNIAEVSVNGSNCGVAWTSPFRLDISDYLKIGENEIEIKVTNLWVNRLIGDCRPEEEHPVTYVGYQHYKHGDPLLPAGLIGPVRVMSQSDVVESVKDIADRVFNLAVGQLQLLDVNTPEGKFPRTSEKGELKYTNPKWWCVGFYPGSLWYTYEYTGDSCIKELAEKYTKQIRVAELNYDHDLGFEVWCSYGNALRITGDPGYKGAIEEAAAMLATRFSPVTQTIRSWNSSQEYKVIIDNMMNLELLEEAAKLTGADSLAVMARTHADATMRNHFREDGTSYHLVCYNESDGSISRKATFQGYADESVWARGQAWGLYGYTMMYRQTGERKYLKQAEMIADLLLGLLPVDGSPYWDFSVPEIPDTFRDASAGAVMASAFVELSTLTDDIAKGEEYLAQAERTIRTLASDKYLGRPGDNHGFLLDPSVGNVNTNNEVNVPFTYADYYFLEALIRYIQQ